MQTTSEGSTQHYEQARSTSFWRSSVWSNGACQPAKDAAQQECEAHVVGRVRVDVVGVDAAGALRGVHLFLRNWLGANLPVPVVDRVDLLIRSKHLQPPSHSRSHMGGCTQPAASPFAREPPWLCRASYAPD